MDWQQTYQRLVQMAGLTLHSISGKTDIVITSVDSEAITVRGQSGTKSRPIEELRRIASKMDLGQPIHVDSVLFGSGSSRNQPETILANMPDVEWLNLNDRKHIVWVGQKTHEIGTLKEIGEFEATEIRTRFRGRGPLTGRRPTNILILAKDPRKASALVAAILQVSSPEPLHGGQGYRISTETTEIVMFPSPASQVEMEIIPTVQVVDKREAINRMRRLYPDLTVETLTAGSTMTVVRIPNSGVVALE